MADIFDSLAGGGGGAVAAPDIFDHVAPKASAGGDIFDHVASASPFPLRATPSPVLSPALAAHDVGGPAAFQSLNAPPPKFDAAMKGDQRGMGARALDAVNAGLGGGGGNRLLNMVTPGKSGILAAFNATRDAAKPLPIENLYAMATQEPSDQHFGMVADELVRRMNGTNAVTHGEVDRYDPYGNRVTPPVEEAAKLAAKGYGNLTPEEKNLFHKQMHIGAAMQEQMQAPTPITPQDESGRVGTALQQFARGGLGTAEMLVPGLATPTDPVERQAFENLLATNAQKYPYTAGAAGLAGAVVDPIMRGAAKGLGAVAAPVIGETPGMLAAVRAGTASRIVGAVQGSAIENAAIGAAASTVGQAMQGQVDPDQIVREAARQAALGPVFHATIGAAGEAVNAARGGPMERPRQPYESAMPLQENPNANVPVRPGPPEQQGRPVEERQIAGGEDLQRQAAQQPQARAPEPARQEPVAPGKDQSIEDLFAARMTAKQVAEKLNITVDEARDTRDRLGIPSTGETDALEKWIASRAKVPQSGVADVHTANPAQVRALEENNGQRQAPAVPQGQRVAEPRDVPSMGETLPPVVQPERMAAGAEPGNVGGRPAGETVKQPWETKLADYLESDAGLNTARRKYANVRNSKPGVADSLTRAEAAHRFAVETALRKGLYVPAEVLADYPDLAKGSPPASSPQESSPAPSQPPAAPPAKKLVNRVGEQVGEDVAGGTQTEPSASVPGNPARKVVDVKQGGGDAQNPQNPQEVNFRQTEKHAPVSNRVGGRSGDVGNLPKSLHAPESTGNGDAKATETFGPGAAGKTDPVFRAETGGADVTPENAPRVIATTLSKPAQAVSQAVKVGDLVRGKLKSATDTGRDAINAISDSVRRYAQQTFPALHRGHAEAGDAAATLIATPELIKRQGDYLASQVLETAGDTSPEFDRKLGAVLVEDQLKGIRRKFTERGETDAAAGVRSVIGAEGSPFATEAEYKKALEDPAIQAGLAAHRQFVQPVTEENYRLSSQMDPETPIPSRGADTNSHISLKAVIEGEGEQHTQAGLKGGGSIENTVRKHSPFEREARGTADQYDLSYGSMVKNSIERGTLPAGQARLYNALVDGGLGVYGKPGGKRPTIDGKPTMAFPVEFRPKEVLYVRADVAKEARLALRIDKAENPMELASKISVGIALMSGVEATAHAANHFAVLYKSPVEGMHLPTWLANVPVVKVAAILDSVATHTYRNAVGNLAAKAQMTDLARLGTLKPEYSSSDRLLPSRLSKFNPIGQIGKIIDALGNASRQTLDDGYRMMVDKGIVKDSPQARRDYINQLGQYHKEAQAGMVRVFRNIGMGPFATAGSTFYTQGLRTLTGSTGASATSMANAIKLRAYVVAQIGGTLATVATLNYMRTGQLQPKGTPWGSLYLWTKDDGTPQYLDVAEGIGIKRGARAVGADAAIEGYRNNATGGQIGDKAIRQVASAAASPFMGPIPTAVVTGMTGFNPHGLYDDAGRAPPGESQVWRNLKTAGKGLNPTIGDLSDDRDQGKSVLDRMAGQLGKFGPRDGKNPRSIPVSPADSLARSLSAGGAAGSFTPADRARFQRISDAVSAKRAGNGPEFARIMHDPAMQPQDRQDVTERLRYPDDLAYRISRLEASAAVKVYDAMTEEEKAKYRPLVMRKIGQEHATAEQKRALWGNRK